MPQRNSITDIWQCATCNVQSHSYANVLAHEIKSHHGRLYNWYLCCIVDGKLDSVTFPNSAADPTSPRQVLARAAELRKQGRHAYAVEVKEILPQEDECPCFEPMDPPLPDGTQRPSGLQAGGLEGSA